MIDWFYTFARKELPGRKFHAATFQFGTFGESTLALVRSLRALVLENQMHWLGGDEHTRERVRHEIRELFAPRDAGWRPRAINDARTALDGIFRAEKFC